MNKLITDMLEVSGRVNRISIIRQALKDKTRIEKLFILQSAIQSIISNPKNFKPLIVKGMLSTYLDGILDG